jgi:hypothetical protein
MAPLGATGSKRRNCMTTGVVRSDVKKSRQQVSECLDIGPIGVAAE